MMTQRELARRLGVTQASVSLALAGRGRLAAATRERIRAAAAKGGLGSDPALAALARRRWEDGRLPAISYLGSLVEGGDPRHDRYWMALQAAAREQGSTIGYVDPRMNGDPVGLAQRIAGHGLLLGQDNLDCQPWQIDWQNHAVVQCGLYAAPGSGDIVCADLLAAPGTAITRLSGQGRLAVVLPLHHGSLAEQLLYAGLHAYASLGRISLWSGSPQTIDAVPEWLVAQRAEQVLGYGDGMAEWLRRRGVRLPTSILALSEDRRQRGCVIPYGAIARRALAMLQGKVRAGVQGAGEGRSIHLVPMAWQDG